MKQVFVGSAVAAVALFFWGFLFWGASTIPYRIMSPVRDEPALLRALSAQLPGGGVYLVPHPSDPDMMKKQQAGPLVEILYRSAGARPPAVTFGGGFLHMFVGAFLMGLLLRQALPALGTYGARVSFVLLAGLAGATYAHLGAPLWWHQPVRFHALFFVYDVTSWLVAGLVLGRFLRTRE